MRWRSFAVVSPTHPARTGSRGGAVNSTIGHGGAARPHAPRSMGVIPPRLWVLRGRGWPDGFEPRGRESAPRLDPSQLSRGSSHDIDFRLRGRRRSRAAFRCVRFLTKAGAIASAAARSSSPSRARSVRRCTVASHGDGKRLWRSDADGGWDWKTAYDACEAATVLFVRKFGSAMRARAASPAGDVADAGEIAILLPTHTRRSKRVKRFSSLARQSCSGLR